MSCGSTPGSGRIKHVDPITGQTESEWEVGPKLPSLPPGWTPVEERTVDIEIDGKRYTVRLCIATNPSEPGCKYIKVGGCQAQGTWDKVCPTSAQQNFGGPGLFSATTTCESVGSIQYNEATGVMQVLFTVGCSQLWVDDKLVNTYIAHPSTPGQFLLSDTFRSIYGSLMPAGSAVQFTADADTGVWNTYMLKGNHFAFDADTGQRVAGAIASAGQDLPPIAALAIDNQLADVRFVHNPN